MNFFENGDGDGSAPSRKTPLKLVRSAVPLPRRQRARRRQRAERQRHRVQLVARDPVGEHVVALHELALHLASVERVQRDVVVRVVAELEAVLDEPAQRRCRGAAVALERRSAGRRTSPTAGKSGWAFANASMIPSAVSGSRLPSGRNATGSSSRRRRSARRASCPPARRAARDDRRRGTGQKPSRHSRPARRGTRRASGRTRPPCGRIWWCIITGTTPSSFGFSALRRPRRALRASRRRRLRASARQRAGRVGDRGSQSRYSSIPSSRAASICAPTWAGP